MLVLKKFMMNWTKELIKETLIRFLAYAGHYANFSGYELITWLERYRNQQNRSIYKVPMENTDKKGINSIPVLK